MIISLHHHHHHLVAKPMLLPFEEYQSTNYKSANIVEGEGFSLRCVVMEGYDRDVTLSWHKYRENASPDSDHLLTINTTDQRIKIETINSTVSVLTISEVGPHDRYYYVCKAHNHIGSYNNTILLRVKGEGTDLGQPTGD